MPWYNNFIPESIKKSVCSCLIKRYLSHFIENEITRDQLNLDLYNGRATAERISLAVEALNELGESQNWPLQFVDGYIDKIHISVPWTSIFSDSTEVEISGLKITVQPKQTREDATSMFESMWNSMTSSMHLAEEFAKGEAAKKEANPHTFEGIEQFAKTIDTVVRKIKVKLTNTEFQIEHLPQESDKGVGLLINIDLMEYYDDYSTENFCDQDTLDPSKADSKKAYLIDTFTTKNIILKGMNVSTVEFSSVDRTVSRSLIRQESKESKSSKDNECFFEATTESQDNDSETESEHLNEEVLDRHVILCGKCYNNQEVKIKLKQSENINGPKVAIELNLGSLILFLSPRQFHILMELVEGFSRPDMEDRSNVFHKNMTQVRPMTEKDYEKVEEQLGNITNSRNLHAFNLLQGHGWATGALEESTDSQYLPMKDANSAMFDSTLSGFSSSMDSSMTSSMVSSMTENTAQTRRRTTNIDTDPTAEISHFQVRVATLAVILLHEDLLAHTVGTEKVLVWQMRNLAQKFFDSVNFSTFSGVVSDGFEPVHKALDSACNMSHLRLLASPLKLEGNETTTSSAFSISGDLTVSKLELTECLYTEGIKNVPIWHFQSPQMAHAPSAAKPNLAVKFKHVQRAAGKSGNSGKKNGPKTEVSMYLDKCCLEFDISIMDRIASLINHPPICKTVQKDSNVWLNSNNAQTSVNSLQEIKISCPMFNFKSRFPIPDFRAATDMSKVPWWERNVRPDYLSLNLQNAIFRTAFQTDKNFSEYEVECKLLDIYYFESENTTGLHVARSGKEEKYISSGQNSVSNTRLSIKLFPKKLDEEGDNIPDPMTHSFYGAFENQGNPDPGPFGAKKVVHESDTPHNRERKDISDAAEQVIPGDKTELDNFIETTTSNAEILVEVTLPAVSVQLESKHIYELIYNRINNDLLLWESQAPKPAAHKAPFMQFSNLALNNQFIVANTGFQYDSDSNSSEEEDTGNVFYSTYDNKMKNNSKYIPVPQRRTSQSDFVMSLKLLEGILSLNPPARDSTDNVIPGQEGELVLKVKNGNVFIVSGYKGDADLGYVCVQVNNAQLFHCDIQPNKPSNSPLKDLSAILGKDLFPTIYQSEEKSIFNTLNRGGIREMFTVALKIRANHETHHVKVVTVSLGLNKATLRHKMGRQPNTWISHIIDFFNVQDYPIAGYVAKDVLTELHVHLWDCAIDYRPLHVPLRSLITIGTFSLSSHLTAAANTSTLTLIFEDCGLFLSDQAPPKDGVASSVKVDLQRDYVNVLELGLFEISIRTTDKQSGINPHIDLRTSINMLRIRTCSDSGRALFQLLTYYINDGDLIPEAQPEEESEPKPGVIEEELVTLRQQEIVLSKSQQEQVSELLEEAMEESPKESSTPVSVQPGAKLFYFPDEREGLEELSPHNIPQVTADLGELKPHHLPSLGSPNIEDFCVIGDEALLLKDGVPEVHWHTHDVEIVDDHFAKPEMKKDPLAPPKDFPTPTSRYTLCDMSIVWQMYGGHDFKRREDPKKGVRFAEKQLSDTVSFSKNRVTLSQVDDARTKGLSWIQKGGSRRDHAVLMELQLSKVKFSHEVYPDTAKQASRQVLSIFDVEIRDRLASSQINKFLYQYSRHSIPKEPHSNMILIKALHSRPDPKIKREECDLKIAILPIRLNIDQDALFFMINFFKELGGDDPENSGSVKDAPSHATPTHQPPIMTVSIDNDDEITQQAIETVNENLILLESRYHAEPEGSAESAVGTDSTSDDAPIYFRYVEFTRDVLIRLDYEGKRVDMSHGPLAGILMGLGHLKCSEIRLKRLVHRHGLLGVNKLISYLLQEWISDIKRHQLSNILGGVGPMKAVVQLFQGIKDLFWLPIEQYQKDGRIVRGLQRGANSFTTSTAVAALELTTRLIYFIQITAETAYDMLSPGPSIRMKRLAKRKNRRKRYHQPQDIREGLTNACIVVKEGIGETADNIIQMAAMEKEQKGFSGAVGAVIRQIPPTIIKPLLIASEATTNVLGGMQSQLVPDARKEANEKWRSDLL